MRNDKLYNKNGFTLIELIVVIVILGILAVTAIPKFIDLSDEAEEAVFVGIASAFKSGVNQVHIAWIIRGKNKAVQNFIKISDPLAGGDLSVNSAGYPADTRGVSLTLNSENDCLDVWRAVLDSQDALVEGDSSSDFEATYNGGNTCTYIFNKQVNLTVDYDSNSGEVIINH
ncbi:type II secretion system protein [Colwellia sp. RSH04]|nr:type II secretion system protein [Colwellia sp. RSH04]